MVLQAEYIIDVGAEAWNLDLADTAELVKGRTGFELGTKSVTVHVVFSLLFSV